MKLNHQIDVLDINPSCGDISCHEHVERSRPESGEGGIALLLSNIPVDGLSRQRLEDTATNELITLGLGFGEDNRLSKDLLLQRRTSLRLGSLDRLRDGIVVLILILTVAIRHCFQVNILGNLHSNDILQNRSLRIWTERHLNRRVPHRGCRSSSRLIPGNINAECVLLVPTSNLLHPRRRRRAEQQALHLFVVGAARTFEDDFDVLGESHVEHLVGLVEDGDVALA
mmetsp:Transcript_4203/g.6930  ORF Transcript_4203/g.6930 Transcript_4203/m.6930 type:complete len:227 (-) Transcript_4203:645-1325(-)